MGFANSANADYSLAQGTSLKTYLRGQIVFGASNLVDTFDGFEQHSQILATKADTLTTAATTILSLDGTGTTNLIIPNGANRSWMVTVKYTAVITGTTGTTDGLSIGDYVQGVAEFGFNKLSNTSTITSAIRDGKVSKNATIDTASLDYAVGGSNDLQLTWTGPTFTGGGDVTMRVVAKLELVEVAF
jgi:predicted TIM-barrel enzyme